MSKEEPDYSEYSTTKTYSIKVKNVKKIDEICKREAIKNKSKIINRMIEAYN